MNRRQNALLLMTAFVAGCFLTPAQRAIPPATVVLHSGTTLREKDDQNAKAVVELTSGMTVVVSRLSADWAFGETPDGKKGYLRRDSFAVRTALFGTDHFRYFQEIGDRLRKIPVLKVVLVEQAGLMPGTALGGVAGATELAIGKDAQIVVGVNGEGSQFLYEVVDLKSAAVLASGETHEVSNPARALDEVAEAIKHAVETAGAAPPTPTPTRRPEPRHPNAPRPLATLPPSQFRAP